MKRTPRKFCSTWARRWFTVEEGALRWYKSPSTLECGGYMRLSDMTGARKFDNSAQGSFSFVVNGTGRSMMLRAESQSDESRWIRGLTLQIDLLKGGTIQGPPCAKSLRRMVTTFSGATADGSLCSPSSSITSGGTLSAQEQRESERQRYRVINDRIRQMVVDKGNSSGSPHFEFSAAAVDAVASSTADNTPLHGGHDSDTTTDDDDNVAGRRSQASSPTITASTRTIMVQPGVRKGSRPSSRQSNSNGYSDEQLQLQQPQQQDCVEPFRQRQSKRRSSRQRNGSRSSSCS
eukprot:17973-Heterococcus_DN1.PRE.1